MLLLYMNNIVIVVRSTSNVNWFKCKFQKIFKIKNLREIKRILDIKIICDQKVKALYLNQFYYVNEVLDRLQISINKSNLTKLSINKYDSLRFIKSKDEQINQRDY